MGGRFHAGMCAGDSLLYYPNRGRGLGVIMGSVESDLARHLSAQERAESLHDCYGDKVIESIVDELFTVGGKVAGLTLHDFCENALTWEDVGMLLLSRSY